MGRQDYETETLIAHSLRAEGFDASEDGTGRGTPLVPVWSVTQDSCPVAIEEQSPTLKIGTGLDMGQPPCIAFMENQRGELRTLEQFNALSTGGGKPGQGYPAVCFTAKDQGADASDISPTLRSGSHSGSHANGGVMPAVAFSANICPTLGKESYSPMKSSTGAALDFSIVQQSAVRRLTPRECERLQGFPDDYTLIPYRGKPAADGPRYKALGSSMAAPVMRWIGERISRVDALAVGMERAA